eukprot:1582261-Pyramimonas_sp.AAC.1
MDWPSEGKRYGNIQEEMTRIDDDGATTTRASTAGTTERIRRSRRNDNAQGNARRRRSSSTPAADPNLHCNNPAPSRPPCPCSIIGDI